MKRSLPIVDRRTLLIGGGVGVGLVVAFALWPRRELSALRTSEGEQRFGHFLKIGRDGRVTVAVPQVETGQGVWTALPQILADELGAAWENIAVEPAPGVAVYANPLAAESGWTEQFGWLRRREIRAAGLMRITAGSTSVRAFEAPLRSAGATARAMLVAAAARRWQIDAAECEAVDGFVIAAGKALAFAELAEDAAGIDLPDEVPLRTGDRSRLVGQPLPRLDAPAKTDGSFRFAGDVRLPDMLYASARLAPHGGRLLGYSRRAAEAAPGVRHLSSTQGWLAVAADNWWSAEQAIRAAAPRFSGSEGSGRGGLLQEFADSLDGAGETIGQHGDYESVVGDSKVLTATYWAAPAQHLGLEPATATARVRAGRLEIWVPTLAPEFARHRAAEEAGLAADHVTLYPMPIGDGGGASFEAPLLPVAIALAKRTGRPVQVGLSAAASQNHQLPAGAALARMYALPDGAAGLAAWKMRIATRNGLTRTLRRLAEAKESEALGSQFGAAAMPPYAIAATTVEAVHGPGHDSGYLRGDPYRSIAFFVESFVDELARAAGVEPLAFRMGMLGGSPRLARCLSTAAALGGWDGGGAGSTMGIACASAFDSHIGLLADATLGPSQQIVVHRLIAAVDCGRIVNPQLVRQQIEGGLIWALGCATVREPEWIAGMPRSRPLGALALPKLKGTPEIRVQLIDSDAPPGGASGLAVPVLAPAIANAIAAGSGLRLRNLPLDPMSAK